MAGALKTAGGSQNKSYTTVQRGFKQKQYWRDVNCTEKVRKIKETLSRRDLCTARIQLIIYTPASNNGTKEQMFKAKGGNSSHKAALKHDFIAKE